jgi:hypothetical protein
MHRQKSDRGPLQGQRRGRNRVAGQGMRVVGLVEEQNVIQQGSLWQLRRGSGIMARMAHDHRGPELGEGVRGPISGVCDWQGGAECQAARQGETHQRQEQQAKDGTLDQG